MVVKKQRCAEIKSCFPGLPFWAAVRCGAIRSNGNTRTEGSTFGRTGRRRLVSSATRTAGSLTQANGSPGAASGTRHGWSLYCPLAGGRKDNREFKIHKHNLSNINRIHVGPGFTFLSRNSDRISISFSQCRGTFWKSKIHTDSQCDTAWSSLFFLKKTRFDCVWVCVTFFLLRRQLQKFHSDWWSHVYSTGQMPGQNAWTKVRVQS